jgi:hypothetical protein
VVTDRPSCTNVQPGTGRLGWLSPMRTSGAGCPGVSFTRRAGHRRAACARRSSACVAPRSTPVSSLGLSRPSGAVRPPGGSGNERRDALRSDTLGRAAGVGLGSGPCVVHDKVPVGSRTGGPRIAAVRAAERLTGGCPSPGTHRPGAAIFPACRFASQRVSAAGSIWWHVTTRRSCSTRGGTPPARPSPAIGPR